MSLGNSTQAKAIGAFSWDIKSNSNELKDTLSYTDTGGEQTIKEMTITDRTVIRSISLDLANITKEGTILVGTIHQ